MDSRSIFLAYLPRGARFFCADDDAGQDLQWFKSQGCETEGTTRDPRLLSLARESYDAIWCARALAKLPIDDCQRVLQIFFQALKPRGGMLFVAHRFSESAFLPLLRQNGFQVLLQGERAEDPESGERWISHVARRI